MHGLSGMCSPLLSVWQRHVKLIHIFIRGDQSIFQFDFFVSVSQKIIIKVLHMIQVFLSFWQSELSPLQGPGLHQ
jgi:hypothetical protein